MEHRKILRINELSKKSKLDGLTEDEKNEQYTLRQEYISELKENFRSTLNNVVLVDSDGTCASLKKMDMKKQ